jgi:eukaryotic-like serine/threonine-protein kinase
MSFVPTPDSVLGSKYRLVRRIAGGGMGSVWLARHLSLDAEVAVKLMSPLIADTPTALSRFEREAKASAQLKSKHIVKVQDYGVEDGTPFMVMELLEGEDLGQRLTRVGKMSLAELSPIFTEICKGLKVAHEAGIVHRDLKPSNVFLAREAEDEIVKLCDFGVARETKTQIVEEKTSSGVVVGSPHHMSPEQAQAGKIDHRSDLWALGVLVYRALTGNKPFDGEALATVMLAVVTKDAPPATGVVPELPADIDKFFARALSREVELRFQSAQAMAEALRAIANGKDASELLALPKVEATRGRDEATLAAAPAAPPATASDSGGAITPPSEATASRELRAVTAGVPTFRRKRSGIAAMAPWVLVIAAVGGLGFYFGRSGTTPAASEPAPPPTPPAGATSHAEQQPAVVPATAQTDTAASSAAPSTSAMPSASAVVTQSPVARPGPPRPPPTAKKRIDDFTGLPTP